MKTKQEILDVLRRAGCTRYGCPIKPAGGMKTQGACHCHDHLSPEERFRQRVIDGVVRDLVERLPE